MGRTFKKYPSKYVKASTQMSACYIDNWNKWVRSNYLDVFNNIMSMANRCFEGSDLSINSPEMIDVTDNGQITGFHRLYKSKSGNEYSIIWQDSQWKLQIYDSVSAEDLMIYAEVMQRFNETFSGIRFHQDRV